MALYQWSTTAASNATADPTINWAEGQSPSSINDSARAMMARITEWVLDTSGSLTTAGSSTAYTLATNEVFDTLAHLSGRKLCFVAHATSTNTVGNSVTLNVDGLGAKAIRFAPSVDLPSGTLVLGTPYVVTYNNTDGAFYLQNLAGNPYGIPLGGLLPYTGTTAPNSAFLLPFGQAISRTTYATYFALVSTTYGVGDGSTTFNIPDLRGRAIFGLGNMGGSDAGLITVAGGNFDGTVLGGTGGAQNHTLTKSEIPTGLFTMTDPGHAHPDLTASSDPTSSDTTTYKYSSRTGSLFPNTTSSATTGITLTDHGGGSAHTSLPPAIVLPYILRVI